MKFFKLVFLSFILIMLFSFAVVCDDTIYQKSNKSEKYTVCGKYTVGNLTFTSYSPSWNDEKLKSLYIELLSNFHGEEFPFLSNIYLYPDSPDGVNGYYYGDISKQNGRYQCGTGAYIELFNAERKNTISKIARVLSHEYGHHYTTYNLIMAEGLYYPEWAKTGYAKIRNLTNYPVYYSLDDTKASHKWDFAEIFAEDYVQLLGSSTAKLSTKYMDSLDLLKNNLPQTYASLSSFNLFPQENPYIPLAGDVEGLCSYLYELGGFTPNITPKQFVKPTITSITAEKNIANKTEYHILFKEVESSEKFEYTLIMYPKTNPMTPLPIKTISTGELPEAVIGGVAIELSNSDNNSNINSIDSTFEGEYFFQIYTKDSNNFIYGSEPYLYDFGYKTVTEEDDEPINQPTSPTTSNNFDCDFDYNFDNSLNNDCDYSKIQMDSTEDNKANYYNFLVTQKYSSFGQCLSALSDFTNYLIFNSSSKTAPFNVSNFKMFLKNLNSMFFDFINS